MSQRSTAIAAGLWLSVALTFACLPRQGGEGGEGTREIEEPAAAGQRSCGAASASAIATLEPAAGGEARCGVSLELADGQLTVRAIPLLGEGIARAAEAGEVLGRGPVPEECGATLERCELWGVHDELGPVLLAAVRGHESEVPVQVYVGWVDDQRLAFAPAWYGLSSVADHTRVGPPWALAPFACAGHISLLPAARLPEAEVEGPSEAVRAAAGRWTIAADGSATPSEPSPKTGGCRPVFSALP